MAWRLLPADMQYTEGRAYAHHLDQRTVHEDVQVERLPRRERESLPADYDFSTTTYSLTVMDSTLCGTLCGTPLPLGPALALTSVGRARK